MQQLAVEQPVRDALPSLKHRTNHTQPPFPPAKLGRMPFRVGALAFGHWTIDKAQMWDRGPRM